MNEPRTVIEAFLNTQLKSKLNSDIVIIGKGQSIDLIDSKKLTNFIVINMNDSELIYPGDLCVFHDSWVSEYFSKNKPGCALYITDKKMNNARQVLCDFIPSNPESSQFQIQRFFGDEIYLEKSLLMSALRIADEIGRISQMKKKVFLLGIDLTTRMGYTKKIPSSTEHFRPEYQEHMVSSQEQSLMSLLMHQDKLSIAIKHVGDKPYSSHSISDFNNDLVTGTEINKEVLEFANEQLVSEMHPKAHRNVKVVAEITTNHLGDIDRLLKMISLCKEAGADYVKLQKRDVETFYTQEQLAQPYESPFGSTFRDYRVGIELDASELDQVASHCEKIGIQWFASVLDQASYSFILDFSPELIKLPSTISEHKTFLRYVAKSFKKDIVISTGYTDSSYEEFLLDTFTECRNLYLLQCTSAYPTPIEDAQVGIVRHYSKLSDRDLRIKPGYSSHDIGSICSMMAVAAGAVMIEKHVKLSSVDWSHFDEVALDLGTDEFKNFVSDIRDAEKITGTENKKVLSSEHHKYWLNESTH
jgi:N-acetylneuraminate synthase